VTSPETDEYNCAAYIAGDLTRKWWPHPNRKRYFWPVDRRDDSLDSFEEGLATLGYERCDSGEPEDGFTKIVIYASDDVRPNEPLHAAIQLPNGHWTSKLGAWEDIEHDSPRDVINPDYGEPRLFLRKRIVL